MLLKGSKKSPCNPHIKYLRPCSPVTTAWLFVYRYMRMDVTAALSRLNISFTDWSSLRT
jgi:hypothetical protein